MADKFISVEFDDRAIVKALQELQRATGDLTPAFNEIGERLVESTVHRFETSTAPDGTPWAPNSQVTYEAYLDRRSGDYLDGKRVGDKKGYFRKDGRVSARSAGILSSKKPLIDSGTLSEQIHKNLIGGHTLEISSSMEYAAMQQFGGTRAEFPQLWGDIPARPFLGISSEDEDVVLSIIKKYLEDGF
ncbi:hypothetical protein A1507_22890 [Methylomonas koyamae]|uniref:Phage virion morphogenesis protein n=1 Tax=Methylomonas koyamae TaxID=702114 RepID=A0A177NT70_9GAMM|nr:phage virion morphogenesis protein [Methylomonas koyamae]OAI20409.1 hypothetical protein A1507_22890 [Methylomonas koyamae]